MQLAVPEFQQRRCYTRLSAVELCWPRITLQLQRIDGITVTWYPVTHENQRPLSHWWDHCHLVPCHTWEPETVITLMGSLSVGTLSHISTKDRYHTDSITVSWYPVTYENQIPLSHWWDHCQLAPCHISEPKTTHYQWLALTASLSAGTQSCMRTKHCYYWFALTASVSPGTVSHTKEPNSNIMMWIMGDGYQVEVTPCMQVNDNGVML